MNCPLAAVRISARTSNVSTSKLKAATRVTKYSEQRLFYPKLIYLENETILTFSTEC